jgi:iron complex outermembrane receptor protein
MRAPAAEPAAAPEKPAATATRSSSPAPAPRAHRHQQRGAHRRAQQGRSADLRQAIHPRSAGHAGAVDQRVERGSGASFAVKTLSLRGLSSDEVLVLVNGKRRHNTATMFINGTTQSGQSPPDLDLIASNAIGRVEVLRDGRRRNMAPMPSRA